MLRRNFLPIKLSMNIFYKNFILHHSMKFIQFFFFLIFLTFVMPLTAHALTISPVRFEVSGDPGKSYNGEIHLYNEESETKTFYSSAQNFESRGESGAPYFLPDTKIGLASWIKVEDSITLEPNEEKLVPFSITIPNTTEAGGYFAAIFWGTSPLQSGEGGQVSIGGKVGTLVLLNVSGKTEEGGGILEFKANGGSFFTSLPISFFYRFSNDGNKRIQPDGRFIVKSMFGQMVFEADINPTHGNILPKSIRKFDLSWNPENIKDKKIQDSFWASMSNQWENFAMGYYTAEAHLTYGEDQKTAESQFKFFVIPWQLLTVMLGILIISFIILFVTIKKYNKWIIAKAIKSNTLSTVSREENTISNDVPKKRIKKKI